MVTTSLELTILLNPFQCRHPQCTNFHMLTRNKVAIVRSRMNSSVLFVLHTHVIIKLLIVDSYYSQLENVARDTTRAINHSAKT